MTRVQRLWTTVVLALVALALPASAGEPPREPILRIEMGMHTDIVSKIAVDRENRYVVTGSFDKTVRVWQLDSGRLLRTLRPPVGAGAEGRIHALAITPDGATVACAGRTGNWDGSTYAVYLFARETGRLVRQVKGLPMAISSLAFSPDGSLLAVGLGKKDNGVCLYRTADGTPAGRDRDYGEGVYDAHFSPDGQFLLTSSFDGSLRRYRVDGGGLRLETKVAAPGGKLPYMARFSPDGTKVAVGYLDSPRVDVLAAGSLAHLYSPDTAKMPSRWTLHCVAWSGDGRLLYAGGGFLLAEMTASSLTPMWGVRKWADGGRGAAADIPVSTDRLYHILPLDRGGFAFGSGEPSLGVVDGSGTVVYRLTPPLANFKSSCDRFLLSADGATVQFPFLPLGLNLGRPAEDSFLPFSTETPKTTTVRFSLEDRSFSEREEDTEALDASPARAETEGLAAPVTRAEGLDITDWKNSTKVALNGSPLPLEPGEMSRSLALAPDGQSFLVGAETSLRCFDRSGAEKWKVSALGIARAVNVSRDGRFAVACFSDGTIRWFDLGTGRELLSFFYHRDRKRWALWTPDGHYDTSPGGEEFIGWHVNDGADREADFFTVGRFRETYYRPGKISNIFDKTDASAAPVPADVVDDLPPEKAQARSVAQLLPPVVSVVSPPEGAEVTAAETQVTFSVKSPDLSPVTVVKAMIDGRPALTLRSADISWKEGGVGQMTLTLPEKSCEVAIIAENGNGASEPALTRLVRKGVAPPEEGFVIKPKLYVFAVGVSKYDDEDLYLRYPAKDASDFVAALEKQKGLLYRDVVVRLLTDGKATRDDVADGLDWIQKETTSKDIAVLFFAGHGLNDSNGIYYFLPVNFDREKMKRTGVVFSDIRSTVNSLAGKTLVFVDTCHSGNVMGRRRAADGDITAVVNELASAENGAVVFASSTGRQYSLEDEAWGNGAFTKALVEGLEGKADYTGKGRITINMLDLYLSERVKELTGGRQTPTTTKPQTIQDFPVVVKR